MVGAVVCTVIIVKKKNNLKNEETGTITIEESFDVTEIKENVSDSEDTNTDGK